MLHAGRQIGLGRLDEEVIVVVHQHKPVQSPSVRLDRTAEPVEPFAAVGVVAHDRPPLVSAGDHVIQRAGKFDSQWSCHTPILIAKPPNRNP